MPSSDVLLACQISKSRRWRSEPLSSSRNRRPKTTSRAQKQAPGAMQVLDDIVCHRPARVLRHTFLALRHRVFWAWASRSLICPSQPVKSCPCVARHDQGLHSHRPSCQYRAASGQSGPSFIISPIEVRDSSHIKRERIQVLLSSSPHLHYGPHAPKSDASRPACSLPCFCLLVSTTLGKMARLPN